MIKLSKRMKAVSAMVTSGYTLADIGTDHAYVPIALVQRGRIKKAIAMDINQGPLQRAKDNISMYRMDEYIEIKQSDGVKALKDGEADSILIAGMGGELLIHILRDGEAVCRKVKELILQPQSDLRKVRRFLREQKYKIIDEDMVLEDGKYYPMMKIVPVDKDPFWDGQKKETIETCDIYGPVLLKNGNPVMRRFLVKQHRQLSGLLAQLQGYPKTAAVEKRIREVEEELYYNETAYTIMGAIKNAGI